MPLNSDFHVLSESVQDLEKSLDRERAKLAFEHGTVLVGFYCAALGAIVLAFMALSLAITATGTARFAVAMSYPAEVGIRGRRDLRFRQGRCCLSALLVLLRRRAFIFLRHHRVVLGSASSLTAALATHATVSTAMAAIERSGAWKMESRSNSKAELAAVEQRLNALSQPTPPRPSKTLAETLAAEKVPPGVWRDSQECQRIRDSKYFQTACAKVLDLRRELAAAEDYEKLDARARELRASPGGCAGCRDLRSPAGSIRCHTRPCAPARRPRRSGTSPDLGHRDHQLLRTRRVKRAQGGGEGGNILIGDH